MLHAWSYSNISHVQLRGYFDTIQKGVIVFIGNIYNLQALFISKYACFKKWLPYSLVQWSHPYKNMHATYFDNNLLHDRLRVLMKNACFILLSLMENVQTDNIFYSLIIVCHVALGI